MKWIFKLFNFLIGACLASHAAVIVDRLGKEDFIFARSKCKSCGYTLSILDEMPLLSYLMLRGRCRYCKAAIPAEYFMFEFVGGFAFYSIECTEISNLATATVIFCLLLSAISDYQKKYYDIILIFPALFLTVLKAFKTVPGYKFADYFQFIPILGLFIIEVARHKLGSGDLIVYLILTFYFKPRLANLTLLTASIFILFFLADQIFFCKQKVKDQKPVAFIPFIFCGLVIQLLIK